MTLHFTLKMADGGIYAIPSRSHVKRHVKNRKDLTASASGSPEVPACNDSGMRLATQIFRECLSSIHWLFTPLGMPWLYSFEFSITEI